MFRELSIFSKIMFGSVAALLLVTLVLGITTAVKASKGEVGTPKNTPVPSQEASLSGTPKPTEIAGTSNTPEPTPEPTKKIVVAIDPGQQKNQDKDLEPVGPGASTTVEKMSYGATSVTTKEREYLWTMRLAEMVKSELEARNFDVVLLRESNDAPDISNSERAQKANEAGANLLIGLQLDGVSSAPTAEGMYFQIASDNNPYVSPDNISASKKLAQILHDTLISKTGANDRGVKNVDNLAIVNWAKMPTVVATLGYATNKEEDARLQTTDYLQKLTGCICDAIEEYLKEE